jgi:drug/metabolite transporter (DMT)-like permease
VFDYSQVVYAALFGIILFGEFPDVWSLVGYVIIIGTAFAKWYLLTQRS